MKQYILLLPASSYLGKFIETFVEYPLRMKAASFNLGDTMEKLQKGRRL